MQQTDPRESAPAADLAAPDATATDAAQQRPTPGWWDPARLPLLTLVFIGGIVSLGIEMSGPRLMAPYFGTTVLIWAAQIGATLLYLAIGYAIGGRVADRYPRREVLCTITTVAALFTALIPFISAPILAKSVEAFSDYFSNSGNPEALFIGTLLGVILLFAVPTILLGMVSPFAVRLSVKRVGEAGTSAGSLYALSTIGSILGAFLPVLVLIPAWGVRRTLFALALALLLASLWGLRLPGRAASLAAGALMLVPLTQPALLGPLKYQNGLIFERESFYNYIQVTKSDDGTYDLILNEGAAIHSRYNPDRVLLGPNWYSDYLLVTPLLNPNYQAGSVSKMAIIGLAGGTMARQFTAAYPGLRIDGAELDPEIISVARKYFGLNEPGLRVYYGDGRTFIRATPETYNVIAVDAFQQPYMPFQLTTREFYTALRQHLAHDGVVVIKSGHCGANYNLVRALSSTLYASGFANVYTMDMGSLDTDIVATNAPTSLAALGANLDREPSGSLIAQASEYAAPALRPAPNEPGGLVFTDDHAPVEQLTDQTILTCVTQGK